MNSNIKNSTAHAFRPIVDFKQILLTSVIAKDQKLSTALKRSREDTVVTTRNVIKVRNVIECYISHFCYISCRNVCDEKCNKKKKVRNVITFYICVHRIGLVFDYFDKYIR